MQIRIPIGEVWTSVILFCKLHDCRVLVEIGPNAEGVFDLTESYCPGFGREVEDVDRQIINYVSKVMTPEEYAHYKGLKTTREDAEVKCYNSWELIIDSLNNIQVGMIDQAINRILGRDEE
jgi:hypothetical protein